MTPDPKPRKRVRWRSQKDWEWVREQKLTRCRACGTRRNLHLHHLIPKGSVHRGDDNPDNLVPLCADCHTGWHGSRRREIGALVRPTLDEQEYAYLVTRANRGWADRYYPKEAA